MRWRNGRYLGYAFDMELHEFLVESWVSSRLDVFFVSLASEEAFL